MSNLAHCALLAFTSLMAFGQEFRSTLSGRVLDPAGAAVPNAKITATGIFNGPELNPTNRNFGRITSAANLPRMYQLALRLRF